MDEQDAINKIAEIDQNMTALHGREKKVVTWLTGQMPTEDRVPKDVLTITDFSSDDYHEAERIFMGKIARPWEERITANSGKEADKRMANAEEDIDAGDLARSGLSPGSYVMQEVERGVVSHIAVGVWTVWAPCRTPYRAPGESNHDYNQRCDDVLKKYMGFRQRVDPLDSLGWLLGPENEITCSTISQRYPVLEYAKAFGKYDSQGMTQEQEYALLANEVAPGLLKNVALGAPESPEAFSQNFSKYVEVKAIDYGGWIYYVVRGLNNNGSSDNKWHEVKRVRNPLGVNSLYVVCGHFRATLPFEFKYNPMAMSLERNYMLMDGANTYLASLMNEAAVMRYAEWSGAEIAAFAGASEEAQRDLLEMNKAMPSEGQRQNIIGKLVSGINPDSIELLKETIAQLRASISQQFPSMVAAQGAEAINDDITATQELSRLAEEEKGYAHPLANIGALLLNKRNGLAHARTYGLNPQLGKAGNTIHVYRRNTPEALHVADREIEIGKEYDYEPTAFLYDKTVTITPIDNDVRAQGIKFDMEMRKYSNPTGAPLTTRRDLLAAAGNTNVDKRQDEINYEQLNRIHTPDIISAVTDRVKLYVAAKMGWAELTPAPMVEGDQAATQDVTQAPEGPQGAPGGGQQMQNPVVQQAEPMVLEPMA